MITHRSSPGKRIDAFPRRPAKLLFVGSRLARADFSFDFVRAQLALAPAMLISVAVLAVQRSGVLFPPNLRPDYTFRIKGSRFKNPATYKIFTSCKNQKIKKAAGQRHFGKLRKFRCPTAFLILPNAALLKILQFPHLPTLFCFFPLCGKNGQLFSGLYLYHRCHMTKLSKRQKF